MDNLLAAQIHQDNVAIGWWDDWPVKEDRANTALMLVITELAEAAEGARKDLMDDHLPDLPMFDVELADAMIRLLDLAGAYQVNVSMNSLPRSFMGKEKILHAGNKLEELYLIVTYMTRSPSLEDKIVFGVACTLIVCEKHSIDIEEIIKRKLAYNKHRLDHKRSERAKEGGKKW